MTYDETDDGPAQVADAVIDVRTVEPDFRAVFERSPVGMALVDSSGRVQRANPALGDLLGREVGTLLGTALHDLAASDDPRRFGVGVGERGLRHQRGHDLWAVVSAVPLPEAGDGALLVCLDDATGRRSTERMLLHAALHDSLTDLPNRRLLSDRLETALARANRSTTTVAVLFVDLDRFKDVNDTFGHDVGDEVLISVANCIFAALRSCDTVARLGGDEFVVVCEEVVTEEDVTGLADRILEGIRRPVRVHGRSVSVTASIGIAIAGPHDQSSDELIRLADLAMYSAKHRPGTAYVLANELLETNAADAPHENGGLLDDLRHAIQADHLQLHYQPVVRVDGTLIGLEALVRWPHPRLGLLMPDDFLPRIAGTDLARPLSDWVLRAAVRDASSVDDPRVRVSVNVWADEVARPGFADTVEMLLSWARLPARRLYLELHEHEVAAAGAGFAVELDRLQRLGVGLAIDDFGAGTTSPAAVDRLPFDTVKVDRSFVAGCVHEREDGVVVAAVAAAARAAGRHPLAAGVETQEQLRVLRDLGYESIQGYLSGAPAPLLHLQDVITNRRVDLERLDLDR